MYSDSLDLSGSCRKLLLIPPSYTHGYDMAHFQALSLHYKKMVVVVPKSDAIRVKIAFILGCLKNTVVNFVRFSPSTIDSFFKKYL